jgi:hypothetical protein
MDTGELDVQHVACRGVVLAEAWVRGIVLAHDRSATMRNGDFWHATA